MDCYFRQSWVDKRLSFEGYEGALALSIEMLRKIWKPDTYGDQLSPPLFLFDLFSFQFQFTMEKSPTFTQLQLQTDL